MKIDEIMKKVKELIKLLKEVEEEEEVEIDSGVMLSRKESLLQEVIVKLMKEVCYKHRIDEVLKVIESKLLREF